MQIHFEGRVSVVSELSEVQRDDVESVTAHFRQRALGLRGGQQVKLDDPFLGGLTYAQYFDLSAEEQDAFWEQIFAEVDDMEAMHEVDIIPDADLSAR